MPKEPDGTGKTAGFWRDYWAFPVKNKSMQFWMVKQEPEAYSWDQFLIDGRTAWTGVRNFQARNNLRAMKKGDLVLYYHSVTGREIVGIGKVCRTAYPDPTATEGDWDCVDLEPNRPLPRSVTLDEVKADAVLKEMPLVKQSRLSVMPLTKAQFDRVLKVAEGGR